jgi:hypothetical protein
MTGTILILAAGIVAYFLPAMVAALLGHRHFAGITILNIFLGWTLVGWVIALVWAVTSPKAARA